MTASFRAHDRFFRARPYKFVFHKAAATMEDEAREPQSSERQQVEGGTLSKLADIRLGPVSLNLRILLEPIGFLRIILLVSGPCSPWAWSLASLLLPRPYRLLYTLFTFSAGSLYICFLSNSRLYVSRRL